MNKNGQAMQMQIYNLVQMNMLRNGMKLPKNIRKFIKGQVEEWKKGGESGLLKYEYMRGNRNINCFTFT